MKCKRKIRSLEKKNLSHELLLEEFRDSNLVSVLRLLNLKLRLVNDPHKADENILDILFLFNWLQFGKRKSGRILPLKF